MRSVFLLYIILFQTFGLFADQFDDTSKLLAKIDSLENVLYNSLKSNLSDEQKAQTCISLATYYSTVSYEKSAEHAIRALKLGEQLDNKSIIAESLNILGEAYFSLDAYENSIDYYSKLYEINISQNKELEAAKALKNIGYNYFHWSKYGKAKQYYERALEIFKKHQYFEGVANVLRGIANILGHWSEYDEALKFNQDALKFCEEIGDIRGIAASYNSMGMLYEELGNLVRAGEYYHNSLKLFKQLKDDRGIMNMTLHIGDIYLSKGLYDKALEYYFKAYEFGKEAKNKKLNSIALSNIGQAYNLKGNYLRALDYQKQALKLKEEIGDKKRLVISYIDLGSIYNNVGDYKKALEYLYDGLKIAKEINIKHQLNNCYKNLSEVYTNLRNFEKAFEYYKLYINGKDEIQSLITNQRIEELQAKYQLEKLEKKNKENESLLQSKKLSTAQIRNQWLIIGFVLFILLGSFVLSIVFHSRYHQNQKLNVQLALKNKEVEQQQENLIKLNEELNQANATKDKFLSIVAHDLKNPFNSLIGLTDLLIEEYDNFTEKERKQFIYQLKESSENTFSLLKNLLEWARMQSNKTELVQEKINISNIAKETITLLTPAANNKKISITSIIPENTFAYADKNMISTIFLNLISNAVKFTPKNGTVEIKSLEENRHIEILIEDSGVGISPGNLNKLFRLDEKYQTSGTNKEQGTGLGLILCKEFIEKNNGKIRVESEVGKGSRFYFSLPKS